MSNINKLKSCAGNWKGTSRLHDPHTNKPEDTPSNLTLTPILNGRFIRIDYTWSYQGAPQEGSMLIGYESDQDLATAHWIDTWHMSNKVMACKGAAETNGSITVLGSYAAPPDPDWHWRIVIKPNDGQSLKILMYNISPQGQEWLAVEGSYKKA